ncbi:MAG: 4Fe-4S dicluster domain-containing protein [Halobacteriota archaeon]|nr:4Fe-4S dicluster domain-containing protein [Halobacteriota archaeon]
MCQYCNPQDCTSFTRASLSTMLIRMMLFVGYFGNIPLAKKVPVRMAESAREKSGIIKALSYEEMVDFVKNAKRGYVFFKSVQPKYCRCRRAHFHRNKETAHPCMDYGNIIEIVPLIKRGNIRILDQEEVLQIVDEAREKHLVHTVTVYNHHEMFSVCSCCGCCCVGIVPYRHGVDQACEPSGKVAISGVDCIGCGACVKHCKSYFNTRKMVKDDGRKVAMPTDRCVGCGTCRDVCPKSCIELVNREEVALA